MQRQKGENRQDRSEDPDQDARSQKRSETRSQEKANRPIHLAYAQPCLVDAVYPLHASYLHL